MIEITFLRHGRSRADDEGVHEGRYDAPLTEVGVRQVEARAKGWKRDGVSYDAIVCSPLLRASESANIVGTALGVSVEVEPDWMEKDNGVQAGLTFAEAAARYPVPDRQPSYAPFCCGTGESDWEFHIRALRALQSLLRRGEGRYLVVAHGGILNAVLRIVMGVPLPVNGLNNVWYVFEDAGYARVGYDAERQQWLVREIQG